MAGTETDVAVFPNHYQNIIPTEPDRVWVADITYIRIASGFIYLAVVLDACSRKVIGYALSRPTLVQPDGLTPKLDQI